jgi:hypothetical protein
MSSEIGKTDNMQETDRKERGRAKQEEKEKHRRDSEWQESKHLM